GLRAAGGAGRAKAAETVGRVHARVRRKLVDKAAHRPELGAGQCLGGVVADEVGAPDGAVEHRAAGEHRRRFAVKDRDVGEVVRGVARGVHGSDEDVVTEGQHVAVGRGDVVEGDVVAGGQDVAGAGAPGEVEAAGHVVVVQVGLEHEPHLDAALGDDREYP